VNFITTAIHPVEMGIADLRSALDAWRHAAEATLDEIRPVIERAQAEEQEIGTELVLEELATALGQMRGGAQRIRTIVTNLRTFSHSGGERPEAVDLAQLIDQTVALVTPRLGEGIEVKLDLDPLAPVTCLPVQMSQVLVNLLLNAADAIGREGTIAVHLWREGDEVRLSVQDDGHGIPPELQSKIFDPFYTTKDVGEGTGLGLYVCQQILASHGGGIEVESIPGEGTEMTLHWPAEANALKKTATA
jgi:two-component system NtrC family sensor kinase